MEKETTEKFETYDCDGCGKTTDMELMVCKYTPYGEGCFCENCLSGEY